MDECARTLAYFRASLNERSFKMIAHSVEQKRNDRGSFSRSTFTGTPILRLQFRAYGVFIVLDHRNGDSAEQPFNDRS